MFTLKAHLLYCIGGLFTVGVICSTLLLIFSPGDQTTNITLIGTGVMTGAGFLIQHFKSREVEQKLDVNTAVTVLAKEEAKEVASQAASVAITTAQGVAQAAAETTAATVAELKQAVNGRMEQMVKLAAEKAYAEGFVAGKAALKEVQEQIHRHQQLNLEQQRVLKEELEKKLKELADKVEQKT